MTMPFTHSHFLFLSASVSIKGCLSTFESHGRQLYRNQSFLSYAKKIGLSFLNSKKKNHVKLVPCQKEDILILR